MKYKEKAKAAAAKKRQRKLAKEVELIAMGAGCFWMGEGYFEYQDDCEVCIGKFMAAVCAEYLLDRECYIFSFYNFSEWASPSKLAKMLDGAIRAKKQQEKEAETE